MTHICVGNLTIIGPDNGLSPGRRPAIIWTNAGILLIGPCWRNTLQWNFNRKSSIFIQENALEHVVCEMTSILSRPQCAKSTKMLTAPIYRCLQDFILGLWSRFLGWLVGNRGGTLVHFNFKVKNCRPHNGHCRNEIITTVTLSSWFDPGS